MEYEIGQSKKEVFKLLGKKVDKHSDYQNSNSPKIELFGINSDVKPLQTYQNVQYWIAQLVKNGRLIDNELDKLFYKLIELNDNASSSMKEIKNILNELFSLKESLKNYRIDIEEFVQVMSMTEHQLESNISNTAFQMLRHVSDTYSKIYDLSLNKLKNISNARVTITNMFLAVMALGISLSSSSINFKSFFIKIFRML